MSSLRLSNGFVAVLAELEQGWIPSVNYEGKPKMVKRWCVKYDGRVYHFRGDQLDKGTYSLRKYGFIKGLIEKTPEMRSKRISASKLSMELWEAVRGLVRLMDADDSKEYRVPQHVRDLGFQRPMVC